MAGSNQDDRATADDAGARVTLEVPPVARFVPTVRALGADLAGRADFDLDFIADLRMAVDEVCTTLVRLADPDGSLRCAFTLDARSMRVEVAVTPRDPLARVSTTGFGWRVLTSLVDEASASTGDGALSELVVHLVKSSEVA